MQNSIKKTFFVAFLLCLVCSVLVSTAAVVLKPEQKRNQMLDKQWNILVAAGLAKQGEAISTSQIQQRFANITPKIVELSTGRFTDQIAAEDFDQYKAAKDPQLSVGLAAKEDLAGIGRKPLYAKVYLLLDAQEQLQKLILPINGYGLWSTLYGFIALEPDFNTIAGLGFYQHAETPGLGGEVDNPLWKAQWPGKKVYLNGEPKIALVKQKSENSQAAAYQVDALSGATLTSQGVSNLLHFWLGEAGFLPLVERMRQENNLPQSAHNSVILP